MVRPTKSPVQGDSRLALGSCSGSSQGGASCPRGAIRAADASTGARSAPLDLTKEHLTDTYPKPAYRALSRVAGEPYGKWMRPNVEGWMPSDDGNHVLSIQPFRAGGYEATLRRINLPYLARMLDARRRSGKREAPEDIDPDMVAKSAARARKKVRKLVKNMGADRLFTLTRRESDPAGFWTRDQWVAAWDRFRRLSEKAGVPLLYVSVLERHKKGNFHLHAAIRGWINIKLARKIWCAICGGRGEGNVDVDYKGMRGRLSPLDRAARIARYISKYMAKSLEGSHEFNRKSYWGSRQQLPEVRRVVMKGGTFGSCVGEALEYLGLDVLAVLQEKGGLFLFPSNGGFWYAYKERHTSDPPF